MAVINNITNTVGDKLWIRATIPLLGVTQINSYTSSTVGETIDYYFDMQFRYSKNGLSYTVWEELTNTNLQAIEISATDIVNFDFLYTHASNLPIPLPHDLTFTSVTLSGDFDEIECGVLYDSSIFGEWFSCIDANQWCFNVTGKLYEKGIVPSYIERGDGEDDADYIAFWKTVACFFAWIVYFARKIGNFDTEKDLYSDFLSQRNLFFCQENSTLSQLKVLGEEYLSEIQKRGTWEIISKENDYNGVLVNGELLRLICWTSIDEFIFNLVPDKYFGWNIGNSSPLWKSLYQQDTLNKSYEPSGDFTDLNLYPTYADTFMSTVVEGDDEVLIIEAVTAGDYSGIVAGNTGTYLAETYRDYVIPINPNYNYEISFWVKMENLGDYFTFVIFTYDKNYNETILLKSDGTISNKFLITRESLAIDGEYYFVRGTIYNFLEEDKVNDTLGIGFGENVRFGEEETNYIIPLIFSDQTITHTVNNKLSIKDLQIKPSSTNFSTGFVQVNNFIEVWLRQRNQSLLPKSNKNIIQFYKLTEPTDPDFGSTTILAIEDKLDWERCIKGFYVESELFPAFTRIINTSTYTKISIMPPSGILPPSEYVYKVEFSNVFTDYDGTLAAGGTERIIVEEYISYPLLEDRMRRYLLPYNVTFKNIY